MEITISIPAYEALHYMAALNETIEKENDPEICSSLLALYDRFRREINKVDGEEMEKLLNKYSI